MSDPDAAADPLIFSISRRTKAIVWAAIVAADLASLVFFESRGLSNLYGDGLAHVERARRIFDSLTPGYAEIGSVWLPLFHLLASPLAINNTMWRTGLAGSLISTAAFALAAGFLFRISCEMNQTRAAGMVTLAAFLFSLNLLYAATTPLTEPLTIFWAVLVVYGLFRFQHSGSSRTLGWTALAAFFGTLTRYDGWYLLPFAALFVLLCRRRAWVERIGQTLLFCLIAGVGPLLWLAHDAYRFHNPWQFYDGPYSAKAIYAHQLASTGFRYPTAGSLWLSAHYYLEDLKLVFGAWPLELAALGFIAWILLQPSRRRAVALLFLVPLLFYPQSFAYGSIPLYIPTLFPHTYYNLRYGLEMAPAVSLFPAFLVSPVLSPSRRRLILLALGAIFAAQSIGMGRAGARQLPLVREGILNTPCKSLAEQGAIHFFEKHYDERIVLVASGEWPCLMTQVGIPYHKTLSQANRKYWRQLRFGASRWVGWIIRKRGDAVDMLMRSFPDAFRDFEIVKQEQLPHGMDLKIYQRKP